MADQAGTHNDGGLVFGTQFVTINSVSYAADDIDISFDTKEIERMGIFGVVDADVLIEQPYKGSLTLQVATTATPRPPIGTVFTIVADNSTSLSVKVTSTSLAYKQDGETKIKCNIKQCFSGTT